MPVFWKKEKREKFKVEGKITEEESLKDFLSKVDGDFIKTCCFPAFLACAYYFGSSDTKAKIEELIDSHV